MFTTYDYQRVLPRDLFNEAKLLKCLGFLSLHIHEGKLKNLTFEYEPEEGEEGFKIALCDEGLFVHNIRFEFELDGEQRTAFFVSRYNSRANFPLIFFHPDTDEFTDVFTEQGEYTPEFLEILQPARSQ